MNRLQCHMSLAIVLSLCCSAGCRWHQWLRRSAVEPPPIAFSSLPSPIEALTAVNANTGRVQTLQAQGATISVPGAPAISADLAVERPQKLRLRAGTQWLGPEVDLGSNDQLFWFWAARAPEPAVYFARHEQFASSRARQMLAIEPAWLIEALGLVSIDPASVVAGPHTAGADRIELRTTLHTGGGAYTRQLLLHAKYGWVLEQHVYDERQQLVASARNLNHEYFPVDGVSLPKRVEVQMPQGMLKLQLDIDRWAINQTLSEPEALFELPRAQFGSQKFVDLADPNFSPPGASAGSSAAPPYTATTAPTPRLRGLSSWR